MTILRLITPAPSASGEGDDRLVIRFLDGLQQRDKYWVEEDDGTPATLAAHEKVSVIFEMVVWTNSCNWFPWS